MKLTVESPCTKETEVPITRRISSAASRGIARTNTGLTTTEQAGDSVGRNVTSRRPKLHVRSGHG